MKNRFIVFISLFFILSSDFALCSYQDDTPWVERREGKNRCIKIESIADRRISQVIKQAVKNGRKNIYVFCDIDEVILKWTEGNEPTLINKDFLNIFQKIKNIPNEIKTDSKYKADITCVFLTAKNRHDSKKIFLRQLADNDIDTHNFFKGVFTKFLHYYVIEGESTKTGQNWYSSLGGKPVFRKPNEGRPPKGDLIKQLFRKKLFDFVVLLDDKKENLFSGDETCKKEDQNT